MNICDIATLADERRLGVEVLKARDEPVFIYGDGEYAEVVERYLAVHGVKVAGRFVDAAYAGRGVASTYEKVQSEHSGLQIVLGIADQEIARKSWARNGYTSVGKPVSLVLSPHYLDSIDAAFVNLHAGELERCRTRLEDAWSRDTLLAYLKTNITGRDQYLRSVQVGDQYFPSMVRLERDAVFADCGAYTGDTLRDFVSRVPDFCGKYYGFEPDPQNYQRLLATIREINGQNFFAFPAGVGQRHGMQKFMVGGNSTTDSKVSDAGDLEVEIRTLDEACPDATFIKLDIEGGEYEALEGARNTIVRNKPQIAVCVYHRPEHLWSIMQLLESMVPGYRFYLRQHRTICTELVLYAVPNP